MGDVVNLGRLRKTKARVKKTQKAMENAEKFGRTKVQKEVENSDRQKAARHLHNHRLDKDA